MGKIKLNKRDQFTIISNSVLKNKNLSLKAKGLYAYMWSLPDDWDYSVAGLTTLLKEGKDAINEALKELEREGYLVRTILREGGKFKDMDYILHEFPQFPPFTENPHTEKPLTGNPQQLNTNKTKKDNNQKNLPTVEGEPPVKKSYNHVFSDPENTVIKDALVKFVGSCRGKNYNPKVSTVEKFAKTLRDNAGSNAELAMRIVDQSINKGWKDLYPLKDKYKAEAISKPFTGETAKDEVGNEVVY
nr:helix-turn-helix domain-containing protein [uncultured Clostridium sp.]